MPDAAPVRGCGETPTPARISHERRIDGLRNLRSAYALAAAVGFWKSLHGEDLIDVYAETVAENGRLRATVEQRELLAANLVAEREARTQVTRPVRAGRSARLGMTMPNRDAVTSSPAFYEERIRHLEEVLRVREESQIPMIPRGAQAKIERLEAERQQAIDALREIAKGTWNVGAEHDLSWRQFARAALAKFGEKP